MKAAPAHPSAISPGATASGKWAKLRRSGGEYSRGRRSKYGNVRRLGYASGAEQARADELHLLAAAGAITELREQVVLEVQPPGCQRVTYRADFTYMENGRLVIEDVKAPATMTDVFRIKWKLSRWKHPDAVHRISMRRRGGGFVVQDE